MDVVALYIACHCVHQRHKRARITFRSSSVSPGKGQRAPLFRFERRFYSRNHRTQWEAQRTRWMSLPPRRSRSMHSAIQLKSRGFLRILIRDRCPNTELDPRFRPMEIRSTEGVSRLRALETTIRRFEVTASRALHNRHFRMWFENCATSFLLACPDHHRLVINAAIIAAELLLPGARSFVSK